MMDFFLSSPSYLTAQMKTNIELFSNMQTTFDSYIYVGNKFASMLVVLVRDAATVLLWRKLGENENESLSFGFANVPKRHRFKMGLLTGFFMRWFRFVLSMCADCCVVTFF